jgi:hypothetical protein
VTSTTSTGVDLYWIPLGAGGRVVRLSGKLFEELSALVHHRAPRDLYHAALEVRTADARFVVEQAPVPDGDGAGRGVVAVGPVGVRPAGRFRRFRYEVRCWRDGVIPDLEAAAATVRVSDDPEVCRRIVELLPTIPTPTWGRDELSAGEMWNSNSIVAWVLSRAGVDLVDVDPPHGGRAPGWEAGRIVAGRTR